MKQVKVEVDNKTILVKQNAETDCVELVEQCIMNLHPDRELAAFLVPKLYIGAKRFIEQYELVSG